MPNVITFINRLNQTVRTLKWNETTSEYSEYTVGPRQSFEETDDAIAPLLEQQVLNNVFIKKTVTP